MAEKLKCKICDRCGRVIEGPPIKVKGKKRELEYCSEDCASSNKNYDNTPILVKLIGYKSLLDKGLI